VYAEPKKKNGQAVWEEIKNLDLGGESF